MAGANDGPLFESGELFKSLLENSPDIITRFDRQLRHLYINPAVEEATGMSPEKFIGRTDKELGMPEHLCSYWAEELHKVFESGIPNKTVEFDFETPTGQKYYQAYLVPEFAEDGSVKTVLSVAREVTDRKKAEIKLKQTLADIEEQVRAKTSQLQWVNESLESEIAERKRAEQALIAREETERALINASSQCLLLIDTQGTVLALNEAVSKKLGKPIEKILGTCLYDHYEPEVARTRKESFTLAVLRGGPIQFVDTRDEMVFETFCNPVFDVEGKVTRLAIFALDITEAVRAREENARLEERLRQSQKLESVGTLAGGIAHDFNNILTSILGYGSLLQMDTEPNDPRRLYINHILTSSEKGAHLTQSLLAFSRKQALSLKPRKINEVIREAEGLLKGLLAENIKFEVKLAASDPTIMADTIQIDQILMNLAANARDAMPKGGKLTMEAGSVFLDDQFSKIHGFGERGDFAMITVSDTGTGMDRETQDKIFEPFYTTKEVGKGTGLGLSTVYGIVKQHNGYIAVDSEPARGTTFSVYLPVVKEQIKKTTSFAPEDLKSGTETILVAEDNPDVRGLVKGVLESKGYTVIEAASGDEAVEQFFTHEDKISLLILDAIMPGKNGKEVCNEIRGARPNAKVLFTSGYAGDFIGAKGLYTENIHFIPKPLLPYDLLIKVREILDDN